jgi:hypothetical protein
LLKTGKDKDGKQNLVYKNSETHLPPSKAGAHKKCAKEYITPLFTPRQLIA